MDLVQDCIIHSEGGKLSSAATSISDARRIATQAFTSGRNNGIVLHFHGGLVSQGAGMDTARRLANRYCGADSYPIFSVWESGLIESIGNNLKDILQDSVFRELLKKTSEWVLREGGSSIATRGAGQAVNAQQLRSDFDRYLCGQTSEPPIQPQSPIQGQVTKGSEPDEDDLALKIEAEIESDADFEQTMAGLFVAAGRVPAATTKGANIQPRAVDVLVDDRALDEMFPKQVNVTRGGIPWFTVAKFVAKVVIAVIRRFATQRDHGAYTTTVEEVLRAAYLAKVGEVIWRQMKQDTADAFGKPDRAGEVVLQTWAGLLQSGLQPPRITLIGHSTGAVYINHWIKRSAELLPGLQYDVILLAPACRCEDFADIIQLHGASIANLRLFAMQDALEQQDRLVPIIYPRSLLYFVSGVVEGDADIPLLGMQRYLGNQELFDAQQFPEVQAVRVYLDHDQQRCVWSIASAGPGCSSASTSHGDFDNDSQTLDSLAWILTKGF